MMKSLIAATASVVFALTGPALAQEQDAAAPGIEFELGGGVLTQPAFEGSADYTVSPMPLITFKRLTLPNGFQIGGGDGMGFSFSPAFNVVGSRDGGDDAVFDAFEPVDTAIELGVGFSYTTQYVKAFSEVRKGVTGHDGVVGDLGIDARFQPSEKLAISVGPRLSWANNSYMDTYFGVSAEASAGSGLNVFDPDSGLKSAGIEATVRYDPNDQWAVQAGAGWDRLIGDAADSPIVTDIGSRDQFRASIGLIRKFNIDF